MNFHGRDRSLLKMRVETLKTPETLAYHQHVAAEAFPSPAQKRVAPNE